MDENIVRKLQFKKSPVSSIKFVMLIVKCSYVLFKKCLRWFHQKIPRSSYDVCKTKVRRNRFDEAPIDESPILIINRSYAWKTPAICQPFFSKYHQIG